MQEMLKSPDQIDSELLEKLQLVREGKIKLGAIPHEWLPDTMLEQQKKYGTPFQIVRGIRDEKDRVEENGFAKLYAEEVSKKKYGGKLNPEITLITCDESLKGVSSTNVKATYEEYVENIGNPRGASAKDRLENMVTSSVLAELEASKTRLLQIETRKRNIKLSKKLSGTESIVVTGPTGAGKSTSIKVLQHILKSTHPDRELAIFDEDTIIGDAYKNPKVIKDILKYLKKAGVDDDQIVRDGKIDKTKIGQFITKDKAHKENIYGITSTYLATKMSDFMNNHSEEFKIFDSPRYDKMLSDSRFSEICSQTDKVIFIDADAETRVDRIRNRSGQNNHMTYIHMQAGYPSGVSFDPKVAAAVGAEQMWNKLLNAGKSPVNIDTTYGSKEALRSDLSKSLLNSGQGKTR